MRCEVIANVLEDGGVVFSAEGKQISEEDAHTLLEDATDWRRIHPKCGSFEEHCGETLMESFRAVNGMNA